MISAVEVMYVVPNRPQLRVIEGDGQSDPALNQLPLDFDELFRRYAPYVGAIALKIMGRDDEVDDLVQDVFIKAHRGLGKLNDPQAIRPWLATIAVRMARRRLRLHWFSRVFRMSDAGEALVDTKASPEQRALVTSVYRCLEKLPANERIVWVLRQVEGQTLEQVAETCGCSLSTVQRRLRAAREFLDNALLERGTAAADSRGAGSAAEEPPADLKSGISTESPKGGEDQ